MKRNPHLSRRAAGLAAGMTLLELVVATGILLVLAGAALPMVRMTVQHQREARLHEALREIRTAIDRYKDAADKNLIQVKAGTEGYPPDLQTLVSGVQLIGVQGAPGTQPGTTQPGASSAFGSSSSPAFSSSSSFSSTFGASSFGSGQPSKRIRFLRRIPVDPMTGNTTWGLRSVQDDPDSSMWGGNDVFDVYSLSAATSLDGSKYSDW